MKLKLPVQQVETPVEQPLVEARITGGMNSYLDPADLPNSTATVARNLRTSADFTRRAPGVTFQTATNTNPPDAKPVLLWTTFTRFDGTVVKIRFSEDRVDKLVGTTWSQITGTLNGTNEDGIRFVQTSDASADYFIFTNNGADKIQVFNSTATSFSALSSSTTINTKYKYITGFFNRVVAANRVASGSSPVSTANPVMIAWSGDFNFSEWNPANDISAGSTPLVEGQSDYMDPITGLFGFASVMLILRERSLWTATKRPVASNPFAFQAAFPYVGCDTPGSATQTKNGITWYDYRSNQVYWYEVGSSPRPIGDPVRNDILGAITDKDLIWGAFDQIRNTYYLTIPSTSTTLSRTFAFNFDTGSWTYDDRNKAYGYYPIDGGATRLNYDQLIGTYDQLGAGAANYDAIGLTAESPPLVYVGYSDGTLSYENSTDTNIEPSEWVSKIFRIPSGDQMISRLMILYEPIRTGSFTVEYRKNGGAWNTYKTVSFDALDGRTRRYFTKLIRANEYQWRLTSSTGDFKLLEFKIDLSASPEDKSQ